MRSFIPGLHYATGAALLLALAPMPYGYYQLLRFAVCAAFIVLAYDARKTDRSAVYWIWLAALAVVYNPIARIHFERDVWAGLNLVAVAALVGDLILRRKAAKPDA